MPWLAMPMIPCATRARRWPTGSRGPWWRPISSTTTWTITSSITCPALGCPRCIASCASARVAPACKLRPGMQRYCARPPPGQRRWTGRVGSCTGCDARSRPTPTLPRPGSSRLGRSPGNVPTSPHDFATAFGYCLPPMLHLNDLTYRIEGRLLFDNATAAISAGHKVGVVGRNGSGKTTLLRLILGELQPDAGGIRLPRATRIGWVAQEAPGGPECLLEFVLAADKERTRLMAEAESARDPARIAEIHERLNDIEAHAAPSRAARILAGLGFDEAAQRRSCAEFSGGWRMRVALAAMLFTEPELLLLDEPTNYLDLEGALWLEDYLADYPHTVLIVSHDRELLNRAVGSILHLAQGKLTLYTGGYDRFEEARREKQRLDLKLKKKQDDERRHIEAFIVRFKAKASKASQAQSRIKALARMQPIAEQIEERVVPFLIPNPAQPLTSPLIRLEGVAVGYLPDVPVLSGLDLRLDADDRIGLLGANGNGKSTFAKLMCGRLQPIAGKRYASSKVAVGYFAQHQMEDLSSGKTPYQHVLEHMPEAVGEQRGEEVVRLL